MCSGAGVIREKPANTLRKRREKMWLDLVRTVQLTPRKTINNGSVLLFYAARSEIEIGGRGPAVIYESPSGAHARGSIAGHFSRSRRTKY